MTDPVAAATNPESEPWFTVNKWVVGASNPWETNTIMRRMSISGSSVISGLPKRSIGFC